MNINTIFKGSRLLAALLAATIAPAASAAWNTNLLTNPGAETAAGGNGSYSANLPGWNVSGELTGISYALGGPLGYPTSTDPGPSNRGANMFGGGYVTASKGRQVIDLGFAQNGITGVGAHFDLSGWLGGYASQNDNAQLSVSFLDSANQIISSSTIGPVLASDRNNQTAMIYKDAAGWVPTNAASAQVDLLMTATGGASNDGYADNLSFSLTLANAVLNAPTIATVGSSFEVTVAALSPFAGDYAGDELLSFGFDLGYDHSLLQLTGISTVAPWDNDSDWLTNVDVAGSTFESIGDNGQSSVELATLSFMVLAQGNSSIDVHSKAATDLNQGLTYLFGNTSALYGRTNLTLVASVPLPGSFALLASGLGLLLSVRSRNRQANCN